MKREKRFEDVNKEISLLLIKTSIKMKREERFEDVNKEIVLYLFSLLNNVKHKTQLIDNRLFT